MHCCLLGLWDIFLAPFHDAFIYTLIEVYTMLIYRGAPFLALQLRDQTETRFWKLFFMDWELDFLWFSS